MKKLFIGLLFAGATVGCSTNKTQTNLNEMNIKGTITTLGATSFQYCTHLLKTDKNIYALKSSSIQLDRYLEQSVTVRGTKVSGYPIEGGPALIEVSAVSKQ